MYQDFAWASSKYKQNLSQMMFSWQDNATDIAFVLKALKLDFVLSILVAIRRITIIYD